MSTIYLLISFLFTMLLLKFILNLSMAARAKKLQKLYTLYIEDGNRSILSKIDRAKKLLTIANVTWIYVHQKKLPNGNIKTIAVDLFDTMGQDPSATYGVFTTEMIYKLFDHAKDEYIRRALEVFKLKYYVSLFYM